MIELKNVSKSYGKKKVLEKLSLTIEDGTVFGLVGINGAGKSTLLRVLAGIFEKDEGQVCVDGEEVFENEKVKKGIFFLPDDPFYTTNVTADDLKMLYKTFYELDEEKLKNYLTTFKLDPKKPIRNFSKGMKRQVFVSLALAIAPKYLFLDEAFDGLDPLARLVFKRGLVELVEEKGTTVIISSHSLRELEDICDGYGILDEGKITSSGNLENELEKVHKYQMAFDRDVEQREFGFACMAYQKTGRVVKLVAKGDGEELRKKIEALKPLFVEEIEVDFEEMFVSEVQSRGYLQ